jgi:IS6 family transposase
MRERGLHIDHMTIYRWVQCYAPELEKRCRPALKATNDSWRVDETYIKVKKVWMSLYRAVDAQGNTLEFLLNPTRDASLGQTFLRESSCCVPYLYVSSPLKNTCTRGTQAT